MTNKLYKLILTAILFLIVSCHSSDSLFDEKIDKISEVVYPFYKNMHLNDHTSSLQNFINTNHKKYKVVFPKGEYKIDATIGLKIPSSSVLIWEHNAIFKCIPNNKKGYRIIKIVKQDGEVVKDIMLVNPSIIGDRANHVVEKSSSNKQISTILGKGEHGHGIVLSGAENVRIINANVEDCWGDGVAIYNAKNTVITNLVANNNRRQGLTITKGENIKIINPTCSNTNGTPPESGIDVEPNYNTDFLKNIQIINPITKNNNGAGITVGCKKLINGVDKNVTVFIENHIDKGSTHGFMVASLKTSTSSVITGEFVNKNSLYVNNKQNGILIRGYSSKNSPKIKIYKPTIKNPNSAAKLSALGQWNCYNKGKK